MNSQVYCNSWGFLCIFFVERLVSIEMNLKEEKLKNIILFFAKEMYLTKTKLMKSLYELDFRHFKETGKSVTNLDYVAWEKGPVPKDVLFKFKKDYSVSDDLKDVIRIIHIKKGIRIANKIKPDLKYFTKREKRILNEIVVIYKDADTKMMIGASHEVNKPWDITRKTKGENEIIDYFLIIDENAPITKEEARQKQEELKETEELFNAICSRSG